MYLLGYDCGTSSIKATIMDAQNGNVVASVISPEKEMPIIAKQQGWAEQNPQDWWDNVKKSTAKVLSKAQVNPSDIKAIGISYQMHGLVCVDKDMQVLRPSIIWCDKVRRQSIDAEDLFYAHIGSMDAFARGLKNAAKMIASKQFGKVIQNRYAGWDTTFGKKVENGQLGFAELEAYTIKNGEPKIQSGRQELLENMLNECLY